MKRLTPLPVLSALSIGSLLLAGCIAQPGTAEEGAPPESPGAAIGHPHLMLTEQAQAQLPDLSSERAAKTLKYYGGPVVQNISVHPLFWNSSVEYQSYLTSFYAAIVTGNQMTFLSQYSTTSPKQTIGNGSSNAAYVDSQGTGTVTDAQIQAHLTALFNAGTLPKPSNNNYYPVHFPVGVSITDGPGNTSCVQFCAYHGTYVYNGQDVYYGVLPDLSQSGCNGGCGGSTVENNETSVASHEFSETVTDAAVGLATVYGPPLAWYNATYGEVGDICNAQETTEILGDGKSYTVQKLWSNKNNACVTP